MLMQWTLSNPAPLWHSSQRRSAGLLSLVGAGFWLACQRGAARTTHELRLGGDNSTARTQRPRSSAGYGATASPPRSAGAPTPQSSQLAGANICPRKPLLSGSKCAPARLKHTHGEPDIKVAGDRRLTDVKASINGRGSLAIGTSAYWQNVKGRLHERGKRRLNSCSASRGRATGR
jgi:hypothetical protein